MITKLKKVYYCEFCKKHNISAGAMGYHEKHCTANPNRECGVCKLPVEKTTAIVKKGVARLKQAHKTLLSHKGKDGASDMGILGTYTYRFNQKMRKIADEVDCPACMLSIIRQSGIRDYLEYYNFKEEMDKIFEERRKKDQEEAEREAIYGTF